MANATPKITKEISKLPPWISVAIEHSDSFRFEALSLLENAQGKLSAIEAKPSADAAATAVAALQPMHMAIKALLAAKAMKARSVRASLNLVQILYGDEVPASLLQQYVDVQGMKTQGVKAIDAAKSFLGTATELVGRTG